MSLALVWASVAGAFETGRISGTVSRHDGTGIGGVTVVVHQTGAVALTGDDGGFRFGGVPGGSYTLLLSLGDRADSLSGVEVTGGAEIAVEHTVDWDVGFAETITVTSASRRRERVVDAPAAITVVGEQEIGRQSATGQVPKALEFTPGVEITQSGLYDFNLNTRGFNSSLNRRVQTLIDGREASINFLGATDWGTLAGVSESLASVELVRGPSSALYGANAFNGVLNLITRPARESAGGRLLLAGGELGFKRADLSWSAGLGNGWYLQLTGGYGETGDFTRSRVATVEYPGLPLEVAAASHKLQGSNLGARLESYSGGGRYALTFERGAADAEGGVGVTGVGRVNLDRSGRDWARANLSTEHWNVLAYVNRWQSPDQLALASGRRLFQDTEQRKVEVQTHRDFRQGKVRLVAGASAKRDDVDTADRQGIQTVIRERTVADYQAVFAQLDLELGERAKLVLAGRWDESSLHDPQLSPKGALMLNLSPKHALRLSYNEAFQVANFTELFSRVPTAIPGVGPALDLSAVEAALCSPFGIRCGFDRPTPALALGNADLELEEIRSFEIGYSGILGDKGYLTLDVYSNRLENLITNLVVNPSGSVNSTFGPYRPPAEHPAPAVLAGALFESLGPLTAFLSNDLDGAPIFALLSLTNAGKVDSQGVDLGLSYAVTSRWLLDFSYSWFDFEIQEEGVGLILPNTPEHKLSAGVTYTGAQHGGSFRVRWVDDFPWAGGLFVGDVDSYGVVDLNAYYDVSDRMTVGLNLSNLLDDRHYEIFGGDVVERHAAGYAKLRW